MTRPLRIVVGPRDARPAEGAITALALRLRAVGLGLGLTGGGMDCSRVRHSPSRMLRFEDGHRRPWLVRVSNHFCPRKTGHPRPHLDLVTFDGVAGEQEAGRVLMRIARGELPWWDAGRAPKRRGQR